MNNDTTITKPKIAPGPRGEILLGDVRSFRRDLLGTLTKGFAAYGDIVRYRLGHRVVHVLSHPDLAQEILVARYREFLKPRKNNGLGLILGDGLVTNGDHESWLSQRRMMQPIFHRQRIAAMVGEMTAACDRLLLRWRAQGLTAPAVNMAAEMMQVTLDIITRTMFGADVSAEAGKVGEAIDIASHFVTSRLQNPLPLPLEWPTPGNRAFRRSRDTLDAIVYGLIRQRRGGDSRGDLLDMLIEARDPETGEGMSEEQIRDEVLTIFAAGHETTSNALTWTWYALAQRPEMMRRLQEEVDAVLAGRAPAAADLPRLSYTQQVFNESLRLYPPVPMIPRRAAGETTLRGYHVPYDSLVFISIYHIHRHPDFWPDAATFDPDRWSPERGTRGYPLAFMPFGAGPRLCIGNNLALVEGTLLLAQIARHYEPRLVSMRPVVPDVAVTMEPKNGLMMTVHPRT